MKSKDRSDNCSISVVVTCFRPGENLKKTLDSLTHQTDPNFEILIINDCSPDPLLNKLCTHLSADNRYKVRFNKKHLGISASRNRACELMTGNIYVPLDADDELPSDAVKKIRLTFRSNPEIDFVFGDYKHIDVESKNEKIVRLKGYCDDQGFLNPCNISIPPGFVMYGGSPFRKGMWEEIGGYNSALDGREDVDFWLRALIRGARGKYVPALLYVWHRSTRGLNAQVRQESWAELYYKIHKKFIQYYAGGSGTILRAVNNNLAAGRSVTAKKVALANIMLYPHNIKLLLVALLPVRCYTFLRGLYRILKKEKAMR